MCTSELSFAGGITSRFYTPLTVGELRQHGFEPVVDTTKGTTTLRRSQPFFWAYPSTLEEAEYESMFIDCLERAHAHEQQFWSVLAQGVLRDDDIFPFAIFPVQSLDKPWAPSQHQPATTAAIREMEVPEPLRARFEERVFNARFLGSIVRTGMGGPLELQSKGCPTMAELVTRSEDGADYTDETVSAMWFGFKLSLQLSAAG